MITQVCCVFDDKANAFGTPFFTQSLGQAERSFIDEVNRVDDKNIMYQHPDDFRLFHLGQYDDSTGEFDTSIPRLIVSGGAVRK